MENWWKLKKIKFFFKKVKNYLVMSKNFRIFASNKTIRMNIYKKYDQIKETVLNDIQGVILTPQYIINKFRKEKEYLNRLHHIFVGYHRETENDSKYIITIFIQNFFTKEWLREEIFVDRNYEPLRINFTTNGQYKQN